MYHVRLEICAWFMRLREFWTVWLGLYLSVPMIRILCEDLRQRPSMHLYKVTSIKCRMTGDRVTWPCWQTAQQHRLLHSTNIIGKYQEMIDCYTSLFGWTLVGSHTLTGRQHNSIDCYTASLGWVLAGKSQDMIDCYTSVFGWNLVGSHWQTSHHSVTQPHLTEPLLVNIYIYAYMYI